MTKKVRVRFAPSPTGPLHIGGVRTALFNYLFAKKHNGTFILRIEDTDQNRFIEGTEDYIVNALNWCGISFDEGPSTMFNTDSRKKGEFGPYKQSERKHLYKQFVEQLIASGNAYFAFDTSEELDFHRKDHEAKGKTFIYNWHNRLKLNNSLSLTAKDVENKLTSGENYVIRFKSPQDQTLKLQDIIRGNITIDTNILDDKILFKSDGMPTYHLANIVDDYLMEITHVIRGEEWLPSLALHQLLYDALGWKAPKFAHLPLIMKPTGKGKLSKRDGDKLGFPVFPLEWADPKSGAISKGYKENGYFPEAVINFLAFLGWNPGTEQEIFSLDQLITEFDLKRVHKAGAHFDPDKTKWYNHHYMQKQNNNDLAKQFLPIINNKLSLIKNESGESQIDSNYVSKVIELIKERATFINEFWGLSYFFFEAPQFYDEKGSKKAFKNGTKELLIELISIINSVENYTVEKLQNQIKSWITLKEIGFGKVMMPLRLALVGALKGPDVFDIMFLIGGKETIKRIEKAVNTI